VIRSESGPLLLHRGALGAKALTGSILGFIVVFAPLYWLLGGTRRFWRAQRPG
jgi:hypothetical protein